MNSENRRSSSRHVVAEVQVSRLGAGRGQGGRAVGGPGRHFREEPMGAGGRHLQGKGPGWDDGQVSLRSWQQGQRVPGTPAGRHREPGRVAAVYPRILKQRDGVMTVCQAQCWSARPGSASLCSSHWSRECTLRRVAELLQTPKRLSQHQGLSITIIHVRSDFSRARSEGFVLEAWRDAPGRPALAAVPRMAPWPTGVLAGPSRPLIENSLVWLRPGGSRHSARRVAASVQHACP